MKPVKSCILFLFAEVLVFSLCACGNSTLTMSTNASVPPYVYFENEKVVGIDAEIAAAIANKLGKKLVIKDMGFDFVVPSVAAGKCDMGMAGLSVSEDWRTFIEDWEKNVDFTISYDFRGQLIVVREDSDINGPDDLIGKKIGAILTTTGYICAIDDYGKENVVRYNKGTDAVMDLAQGKLDCVIINSRSARQLAAANKGMKVLDHGYIVENYAIAIAKTNTKLLNKVNQAILDLTRDGTIKNIVNKYIYSQE